MKVEPLSANTEKKNDNSWIGKRLSGDSVVEGEKKKERSRGLEEESKRDSEIQRSDERVSTVKLEAEPYKYLKA